MSSVNVPPKTNRTLVDHEATWGRAKLGKRDLAFFLCTACTKYHCQCKITESLSRKGPEHRRKSKVPPKLCTENEKCRLLPEGNDGKSGHVT